MKRKPNKPQQEPRERPGSWEEPADPGGASSGDAGGGSPGGAGTEGTSGQSVQNMGHPAKSQDLWGEEEQQSGRILAAMPPKELKRSLRRRSSGRKANRSRPPRLSSAWKSAGKSWRRPKASWQNRSPRKSRAPSGGWAAPLAAPFTALCMGRFTKTSRKTWASRGPTAPSWWARPPCGMAPGL